MDIMEIRHDERAVSPVVGTVLVVAITVVLAAVVGTTAFGLLGSIGSTAPQATFAWDANLTAENDTVAVQHAGGEAVTARNLDVVTDDARAYIYQSGHGRFDPREKVISTTHTGNAFGDNSTVQLGDRYKVNKTQFGYYGPWDDSHLYLNASTVRLVWRDGGRSTVLSSWEGPDA